MVTAECDGDVYYSYDRVLSNPLNTFKIKKGQIVKINLRANPDENGDLPKIKMYVNLTSSYGNENDPVYIKSKSSFIANVKANSTVVYMDGTSGGLFSGKGIYITGDRDVIKNTAVFVNSVEYTDTDNDGIIEFSLSGSQDQLVAAHHSFSITNYSSYDANYYIKTGEIVYEGVAAEECEHIFDKYLTVAEPTVDMDGLAIYKCRLCEEERTEPLVKFEEYMKGDLNGDGRVSAVDSNMLIRIIVGGQYDQSIMKTADVYEDGVVDALDSYILKKIVAGN